MYTIKQNLQRLGENILATKSIIIQPSNQSQTCFVILFGVGRSRWDIPLLKVSNLSWTETLKQSGLNYSCNVTFSKTRMKVWECFGPLAQSKTHKSLNVFQYKAIINYKNYTTSHYFIDQKRNSLEISVCFYGSNSVCLCCSAAAWLKTNILHFHMNNVLCVRRADLWRREE